MDVASYADTCTPRGLQYRDLGNCYGQLQNTTDGARRYSDNSTCARSTVGDPELARPFTLTTYHAHLVLIPEVVSTIPVPTKVLQKR